ncbi:attachment glycoprotein [Wufeng Eothenomys melanogaster jeilongvirus 1]|uniref:Attachment glycoprotein n=1 Tax=Wufeng Eothenomys melanogaster jeilongvirus 1 TaxID=2928990 RepID=A0A8T9KMH5_9MONO|nr:attachment glycoprotein [Wufeng Eothenomys melanogaster jeilongvirus 1]
MSNFYGANQTGINGVRMEAPTENHAIFRYTSMIVGLLSLFTIIALNVTNIIYMTESGGTMESIKNVQQSLSGSMKETSGILIEDIKPKTDLINSMVSFNIPSQLTLIYTTLKNEVLRQCTPTFMFNNTICPLAENPSHSQYVEEVHLSGLSACTGQEGEVVVNTGIVLTEYPSFIPGSTKPGSCVKLPSFSMSSSLFAYSHTIMGHGCSELDVGDHYFMVGKVADNGGDQPIFETITEWYISDKINRRSCTVAAGVYSSWMGCVIMTEPFLDDLTSSDTGKVSILYLDVYGRRREWLYSKSEIRYDQNYASLYFSVGSGVVIGDNVYFLIWGSLVYPIEQNAYCDALYCRDYTQQMCNQAQRPQVFGYNQMVNGILFFNTNTNGKPVLSVRTFAPRLIPLGTEGRLIYFSSINTTYIYLRSTGWHALPLTGIVKLSDPLDIKWIQQSATSRPGKEPCGATSRCPRQCVTGVYTDLYPLGLNYEYTMTVYLNSENVRVNPTLAFSNTSSQLYSQVLTNTTQRADYTTTTCFTYKLRIWCLSIVELSPSTITSFEPVPFLYQLDLGCRSKATNQIRPLNGQKSKMKLGPYVNDRKECYFEYLEPNFYLIISIPSSIQAYIVRDLEPDQVPHTGVYINDICPILLNTYTSLSSSARLMTTIMVGKWQFRPVVYPGGQRIELPIRKTNVTFGSGYSPEDPGHDYYSGLNTILNDIKEDPSKTLVEICYRVRSYVNNRTLIDTHCQVYSDYEIEENIYESTPAMPTLSPEERTKITTVTLSKVLTTTVNMIKNTTGTVRSNVSLTSNGTIKSIELITPNPLINLNTTVLKVTNISKDIQNTKLVDLLQPVTSTIKTTTLLKSINEGSLTYESSSIGRSTMDINPGTQSSTAKHTEEESEIPTTIPPLEGLKSNTTETPRTTQEDRIRENNTNHRETENTTTFTNRDPAIISTKKGAPYTAPLTPPTTGAISHADQIRLNNTPDNSPEQETKTNTTRSPDKQGATTPKDESTHGNKTKSTQTNKTAIQVTLKNPTGDQSEGKGDKPPTFTARDHPTQEPASISSTHAIGRDTSKNKSQNQQPPAPTTSSAPTPRGEGNDINKESLAATTANIIEPHSSHQDSNPRANTLKPSQQSSTPTTPNQQNNKSTDRVVDTQQRSINNGSSGETETKGIPPSQTRSQDSTSTLQLLNAHDLAEAVHTEVGTTLADGDIYIEIIKSNKSNNHDIQDNASLPLCLPLERLCTDTRLEVRGGALVCNSKNYEVLCGIQSATLNLMNSDCEGGYTNTSLASMLGTMPSDYGDCSKDESLKLGHNYVCNLDNNHYLGDRKHICSGPDYEVNTNIVKPIVINSTNPVAENLTWPEGKYPFTYQELLEWAGSYSNKNNKELCGLGEFCGYTFILYYGRNVMIPFEAMVLYKGNNSSSSMKIPINKICIKLLKMLVQLETPHHHLVILPLETKYLILRSTNYLDFVELSGTKSRCSKDYNRYAYLYSKSKGGKNQVSTDMNTDSELVTEQPLKLRKVRSTVNKPETTSNVDNFADLLMSALESLWYRRR